MRIGICVITYNRLNSLKRLLSSLERAYYPYEVDLNISIDKSNTDQIEKFAYNYKWKNGRKIIHVHDVNLGLRKHILSCGALLENYDALVVLEDDLVLSPNFFYYAEATINKYQHDENIAGISLYNPPLNNHNYWPFMPVKDQYDVYMMQLAQSWGQIWLKKQWKGFLKWYNENSEEFGEESHLPISICHWPKSSWLKYHIRYCIEQNKYFVYPYVSLSTNCGEVGEHSERSSNLFQVPLQFGIKKGYLLPDFSVSVKYDGFYENSSIKDYLNIDDLCVDLYAIKNNRLNNRYWLTTARENYKIIKSYAIQYLPLDVNVLRENYGEGIYLYDTNVKEKFSGSIKDSNLLCRTLFHNRTSLLFVHMYGFKHLVKDVFEFVIRKLKIRKK